MGAGASAHTLPIVSKIPEKLKEAIEDLYNLRNLEGVDSNEIEKVNYAVDDLLWLQKESARHASIDTFAKKLFVKNKIEELDRLKSSTGLFFSILQTKYKVDPRYDQFIASIIGNSIQELPKDICIVSWNYDNQFELAFKEYSENYDIEVQEAFLGMVHKNHLNHVEEDKFKIFKINGTSGSFSYGNGTKSNLLKRAYQVFDNIFLRDLINDYLRICDNMSHSNFRPLMSFAWEQDKRFSELKNQLKKKISNCPKKS